MDDQQDVRLGRGTTQDGQPGQGATGRVERPPRPLLQEVQHPTGRHVGDVHVLDDETVRAPVG
ncbi:hypothetical protein ABZ943_08685, partial [Streptomyces rubiginosohelvolus]|uniref:hypothetical protein n=1 Tax=Streptomyces rubiginosohelvolus TaxID=67362 RepID=UPI0033D3376D